MSQPVNGTDVVVNIGGRLILCATEVNYTPDVDLIEKTGPNSTSRERVRRLEDHKASVTGITHILSDEQLTYFDLWSIRKVPQTFDISFEDPEGNSMQLSGLGIFGAMPITAGSVGFASATIEIFFNGEPSLTEGGDSS